MHILFVTANRIGGAMFCARRGDRCTASRITTNCSRSTSRRHTCLMASLTVDRALEAAAALWRNTTSECKLRDLDDVRIH